MVQFYRHFPITGPLSLADMADASIWLPHLSEMVLPRPTLWPPPPTYFHNQWAHPVNSQNREIRME
jgi:hypothetical protein